MKNKLSYISIALLLCLLLQDCKSSVLTDADKQYERGEYFEAQKTYRKIYNSLKKKEQKKEKAYTAFQLGNCYFKLNQPARASNSFQNAIRYGYADSTVYLLLSQSLIKEGKYKDAEKYLSDFLQNHPDSKSGMNSLLTVRNVLNKDNKTRYIVKEAKYLNSSRSDFSPAFVSKDFDVLYFTSTNEQTEGSVRSGITGMKNGDIWMIKKNEHGKWLAPEPVQGDLNTGFDEGIISFSPDGSLMYLTRALKSDENDTRVEIWTSRRSDAQWSAPVKIDIDLDTLYNYGHPSVSPDGKYLYLSSDRPGGYGGYDIWRIDLDRKGSQLVNLGPEINSAGNEFFPYSRNDSTLYFSSDGHPGFGGLDIFKASLNPAFSWSITNMGTPINSSYDDFGIVFEEGEKGFFSTNRNDQRGYDHIYTFDLPEINVRVTGFVMDPEDYIIPEAYVRIIGDDGSNRRERIKDDGSFSFTLVRGVNYILQAVAEGYLNANQQFTSDIDEEDAEYIVDFRLAPLDKPIVIDNIFYDYDKATLRPESKSALDSLVDILEQYPYITIELSSHTDRIGSDNYNNHLSERRALSVVNYLVENGGIDPKRLTYTGYGKTKPMTVTPRLSKLYPEFEEGIILTPEFINSLEDDSYKADADQINRRTEFKITSTDFYLY